MLTLASRIYLYLSPFVVLVGCATAPVPIAPPVSDPETHVQREILERSRGDFSAVETRTYRALERRVAPPDWGALVESEFEGKYRRDVKTSYAIKLNKMPPFESFESVTLLIAELNNVSEEESVKAAYLDANGKS